MTFEIFKAFPPNRETAVAELHVRQDGVIEVPAEVYRSEGQLRIVLFGREGGAAWEYPLSDWMGALERAVDALG